MRTMMTPRVVVIVFVLLLHIVPRAKAAERQTPPAPPEQTCQPVKPPVASPEQTCVIQVAKTADTLSSIGLPPGFTEPASPRLRYRLTLETTKVQTQLWVRFVPAAPAWTSLVDWKQHGPPPGISAVESDVTTARHTFFFWSYPAGKLTIRRQDLDPDEMVGVVVRVEREKPNAPFAAQLERGYSARFTLDTGHYDAITLYARCALEDVKNAGKCRNAGLSAQTVSEGLKAWFETRPFDRSDDRLIDYVYFLVSRWMGRDPVSEYLTVKHASLSEPIVLFVGASGLNRVVLLDCQRSNREDQPARRQCGGYSQPSARTLQRADYFWALYVEDDETPYETSIDVEFGRAARDTDYEEFDPRVALASQLSVPEKSRIVRVGFRRFRMREAPSTVQVAFSRQGPSYGLRQWVRVYNQRSKAFIIPAASVFASAVPATRQNTILGPVYRDGGIEPVALELQQTETRRALFALLAIQWPQLRSRADDAPSINRLLKNLVPDVAVGLADSRTFFTGGSWPIPLWNQRSFITAGFAWTQQTRPIAAFGTNARVPLGTQNGNVIEERWFPIAGEWLDAIKIGLSIELLKLRK